MVGGEIPRALEETDTLSTHLRELRRTFLDQLAYVCDNIKGGDTVAAIALEAQPSGVTFWAASNNNVPAQETFINPLEGFRVFNGDVSKLCHFSYQQRSCNCMKALQRHIGEGSTEMADSDARRQDFILTRHYIGRLGSHIRAAKLLVAGGLRKPSLFDNFNIRARPSPKQHSSLPPTDHLITLQGILKRMLPRDSGKMGQYQEALTAMDAMFKIQDRLHALYQQRDSRPRVHAELNLLEYFHAKHLPFVDDHRFIGRSKSAVDVRKAALKTSFFCYEVLVGPGTGCMGHGFIPATTHGRPGKALRLRLEVVPADRVHSIYEQPCQHKDEPVVEIAVESDWLATGFPRSAIAWC
ncbi:hypothetical protein V502_00239 [Pseudogymnoascus sp. VKM F-4520 (FW-2644)]|nr:hypothetical protein V502_00239 [Pseudogymnoascus sp. VKM F-4520 (FW-2644)]